VIASIQRWGGALIRPKVTFEHFHAEHRADPTVGRWDVWWLTGVYVLGSQVQPVSESIARWQALDSVLVLINGLALALLAPILVGLLAEGVLGARHRAYGNLTLVPLVLLATMANLLGQQGVTLPGPHMLPEVLGATWAIGLGFWARARLPGFELADKSKTSKKKTAAEPTVPEPEEVTHG